MVDAFGTDPTGQKDSVEAIQKAMDSGATTAFLPGNYRLLSTVIIRGPVRRVVGLGGMINNGQRLRPNFRLADGAAPVVFLEHFAAMHGGLELNTRRTLVLRSVQGCDLTCTVPAEGGHDGEWREVRRDLEWAG